MDHSGRAGRWLDAALTAAVVALAYLIVSMWLPAWALHLIWLPVLAWVACLGMSV